MKKAFILVLVLLTCVVSLSLGMGEGAPGTDFSLMDFWYENGDLSAGTILFDEDSGRFASVEAGSGRAVNGTYAKDAEKNAVVLTADGGETYMTLELTNRARLTDAATGVVYLRSTAITGRVVDENIGHDTETETADDGESIKFKDYDLQIVATFPKEMSVRESLIEDAVVISDGQEGYVTGRNVTEAYSAKTGTDDEFAAEYIAKYIASDFEALFGAAPGEFEPLFVGSDESNRVATAEIEMISGDLDIQVFVIFFTCTFSNGDEMVIAKTFYADAGDDAQMDALWDGVIISAVRRAA